MREEWGRKRCKERMRGERGHNEERIREGNEGECGENEGRMMEAEGTLRGE